MPNDNNQLAEAVNSPLKEVKFENVIAAPLIACAEAQKEASMAAYKYMMALGFQTDKTGLADHEPVPISFYFVHEGVTHRLTMPLISLVPIPFLQIGHIDLNYQAMVTASDNDSLKVRYSSSALDTFKDERNLNSSNSIVARETIDIRLRATTSDMPAGMAKLMEILNTQLTDINDVESE